MRILTNFVLAGALLGFSTIGSADPYVNSVTVAAVQLTAADGASVQLQLQNNQPMPDCYYNIMRIPSAPSDFQKQAYATFLAAKINGLVVSHVAYSVVSPGVCELVSVLL